MQASPGRPEKRPAAAGGFRPPRIGLALLGLLLGRRAGARPAFSRTAGRGGRPARARPGQRFGPRRDCRRHGGGWRGDGRRHRPLGCSGAEAQRRSERGRGVGRRGGFDDRPAARRGPGGGRGSFLRAQTCPSRDGFSRSLSRLRHRDPDRRSGQGVPAGFTALPDRCLRRLRIRRRQAAAMAQSFVFRFKETAGEGAAERQSSFSASSRKASGTERGGASAAAA